MRLAAEIAEENPITLSLHKPATYRASDLSTDITGSRFTVSTPEGSVRISSALRGRFNVYNVLGALAAARSLGVPLQRAAEAVRSAGQVPGRFQMVDAGQEFAVVVDYAHTPDSLENVLKAARELVDDHSRLHVVFGCGGDRDRGKRPLMGTLARTLADRVIVTSDNPRSEDPEAIIGEIIAGANGSAELSCEVDRRAAIAEAIADAQPGDVVVIAGKGHEQGQEFESGRKVPFDDVTVAREILSPVSLKTAPRPQ
jgi:UDP-N-acetylmuramoyl-L-alanyl-D-glutamate--2,6-diaminopimelate ligase